MRLPWVAVVAATGLFANVAGECISPDLLARRDAALADKDAALAAAQVATRREQQLCEERLRTSVNDCMAQIRDAENICSATNANLQAATTRVKSLEAHVQSLDTLVQSAEARAQTAEERYKDASSKLTAALERIAHLEAQVTTVVSEKQSLDHDLQQLRTELTQLDRTGSEMQSLKTEATQLAESLKQCTVESDMRAREAAEARVSADAIVASAEAKMEALKKETADHITAVEKRLVDTQVEAQKEVHTARSQMQSMENQVNSLMERAQAAESALYGAEVDLQTIEAELNALKNRKAAVLSVADAQEHAKQLLMVYRCALDAAARKIRHTWASPQAAPLRQLSAEGLARANTLVSSLSEKAGPSLMYMKEVARGAAGKLSGYKAPFERSFTVVQHTFYDRMRPAVEVAAEKAYETFELTRKHTMTALEGSRIVSDVFDMARKAAVTTKAGTSAFRRSLSESVDHFVEAYPEIQEAIPVTAADRFVAVVYIVIVGITALYICFRIALFVARLIFRLLRFCIFGSRKVVPVEAKMTKMSAKKTSKSTSAASPGKATSGKPISVKVEQGSFETLETATSVSAVGTPRRDAKLRKVSKK